VLFSFDRLLLTLGMTNEERQKYALIVRYWERVSDRLKGEAERLEGIARERIQGMIREQLKASAKRLNWPELILID
jgi:hypothetical protein